MSKREFDLTAEFKEDLFEAEKIDTQPWRQGYRTAVLIEADGEHWKIWIDVHFSEGWQFYGNTVTGRDSFESKSLTTGEFNEP